MPPAVPLHAALAVAVGLLTGAVAAVFYHVLSRLRATPPTIRIPPIGNAWTPPRGEGFLPEAPRRWRLAEGSDDAAPRPDGITR